MSIPSSAKFPSGRSVSNCQNDAKKLKKSLGIPLHEALDRIARMNGINLPWSLAIASLKVINLPTVNGITAFMNEADIQKVLDDHPLLTHFGMGLSQTSRVPRTPQQYHDELTAERLRLLRAVDECNKACMFLKYVNKRQTSNTDSTSYGLKHAAQRFVDHYPGIMDPYVSNGSFICAAVFMGFQISEKYPSPNVTINWSSRSPVFQFHKLNLRSRFRMPKLEAERLAALKMQLGLPQ